jgi:hypothetical protein
MTLLQVSHLASRLNPTELKEEFSKAKEKLKFLTLDLNKSLQAGAVLVSKSGNLRLILSNQVNQNGRQSLFILNKTHRGTLIFERAEDRQIELNKIQAIVARKHGSPLQNYSAIIKYVEGYTDVMSNTALFLGLSELGKELKNEIEKDVNSKKYGTTIHVGLDTQSGRIEAIDEHSLLGLHMPLGIKFGKLASPANDYIEKLLFYSEIKAGMKSNLILASILANTIQNAQNFVGTDLILNPRER